MDVVSGLFRAVKMIDADVVGRKMPTCAELAAGSLGLLLVCLL
jgi:hypothetical protein